MRTDATWFEIGRAVRRGLTQQPQPLVEEEAAPGRMLFAPRRSLALLGTMFGMCGAGAVGSVPTHPGATTAMTGVLGDDDADGCLLSIWGDCGGREIDGPPIEAVLPVGRRRDPAW